MAPTRDWFDGNGRLAKRVKNFGSTDPAPQANYYLRSSVTGAVLSETEQTGRKLKTFVPANGTTLAEQELVTIGSTTTEKLTFIHQDPSLASLQRTDNAGNLVNSNARAGEYDALGRNVADPGPYVTLNTDPPVGDSGGSGINLDGTAQGYRPGRINYFADGLPVPEDYARDLINSGRMGGIFGVVEAAVRISNRDGQWIDSDGPCTVSPGNDFCVGTATRYFQLDSSWGASGLMNGMRGTPSTDDPVSHVTSASGPDPLPPPLPPTDCNNKVLVDVSNNASDASSDGAVSKTPYLNAIVAQDFNDAVWAIAEGGVVVGFTDLFRPFDVQVEYWRRYQENQKAAANGENIPYPNIKKAARVTPNDYPGRSNHGAGFAFDMGLNFQNRRLKRGKFKGKTVREVFEAFGFLRNEPNDYPHFNYKVKPTEAQKLEAQNYYRDCL
ncbi:MAG: D-alanyl-D-alanine carboxypeptidase family protein [Acidobacteria bacterium]|nr:D-alanyl-D-alanine carboxypeptidase family protein [Acidobacteriota bacterium]